MTSSMCIPLSNTLGVAKGEHDPSNDHRQFDIGHEFLALCESGHKINVNFEQNSCLFGTHLHSQRILKVTRMCTVTRL